MLSSRSCLTKLSGTSPKTYLPNHFPPLSSPPPFQLADSVGRKKRYVPSNVDIEQTPLKRAGVLKRNSESEISEECAEGSVQVDNQCSKFSFSSCIVFCFLT